MPLSIGKSRVYTPDLDQLHREGSNPPEAGTTFQPYKVIMEPQALDPVRFPWSIYCGAHFHFLQSAIMHTTTQRLSHSTSFSQSPGLPI